MNNCGNEHHPPEEQLMEYAMKEKTGEIERHLDGCPSCARMVKEFRQVKSLVSESEEEEVPVRTERRILRLSRHGRSSSGPLPGLPSLLSNPMFLALAVAIVLVLIYFLVGSEVFKGP
jgi:anti-sigma factor RsiW